MDIIREFEPIFHPKSVAVVGVSADGENAGNRFLRAMIHFGFRGKLYPINRDFEKLFVPSIRRGA